jgi:hypothetical protein
LARWQAYEAEQAVSCFLQAVGNGAMLEPPFADKGLAANGDLLRRRRIDHVVVVCGNLVMQALRSVRKQVSVLVDRAALHRHAVPDRGDGVVEPRRAIDNEEFWPPQSALDEIAEDSAPPAPSAPFKRQVSIDKETGNAVGDAGLSAPDAGRRCADREHVPGRHQDRCHGRAAHLGFGAHPNAAFHDTSPAMPVEQAFLHWCAILMKQDCSRPNVWA